MRKFMEAGTEQVRVPIDKGVPYPTRVRPRKFPLEEMEVGDSLLAEVSEKSILYHYMKTNLPKRFVTRTVRENGEAALRVWRIA